MEAYVFKIALLYSKHIYRRIAILGNQSLDDLHDTIFLAFDRYDEHLYSFYFPTNPTSSNLKIRQSRQYSHPMALGSFSQEDKNDATNTRIDSLDIHDKSKFYCLFYFGDEWWHEITFEGIKECSSDDYPAILLKKGASQSQYPDID